LALERASASLVLFLGLALVVSGCTKLGPDFSTPPVPEPESWIESDNPKLKSEPAEIDTWWTVFDDPVLNRLIEIATGDNLSLQVAGIRILEARARLGIAVGDQYPQVQEASGDVAHNTISENAPNTAGLNRSFQSGSVGFDASWEMDFWGRFQRGIESADASLGATIADYDDFLVSLTADVASTYALIRELEERVELARQNVDLQQRTLKITDVRFRGGAVSELDVAQAQSLLSSTQALVPDLLRQLRQAENALAVLLGKTPREVRALLGEPGSIPSAPAEVAVGIPAELLRRRPDIRRTELAAAAQSARIGIAEADLYPRFTLGGFIGLATSDNGGSASNNADFGDLFSSDSFTTFIGPSVSLPIFNYGRLTNNVRVEDAQFQELLVSYQDTVLRAYQEVEDGLVGFLREQERARFLGTSVTAAERAAELSLLQYRQGLVDFIRVVDSQSNLVDRQDEHSASRGQITRNLIFTYRALGGGWTVRGPNDYVPEAVQVEMRTRTDWGDIIPPSDLEKAPRSGDEVNLQEIQFRRPDW
jgi:NodT family efflux transporter outer membrane factor (OMF) lipoprotein